MSNPLLPTEILDQVVDHLHDEEPALRNCCLVSKSWIPRTRTHLFADIKLQTQRKLESWKETFPDPSTSPAHHARTLSISCSRNITAADAGAGSWISSFSRVVRLVVNSQGLFPSMQLGSLTPFHGFSPIKSLHVDVYAVPSHIFDLILSFPLFEDLTIRTHSKMFNDGDGSYRPPTTVRPSISPAFSGSLELSMVGGMRPIALWLLSLPGGVHFRELSLTWAEEEDIALTMAFMERCAPTVESLDITCNSRVEPGLTFIDLSKATRLAAVAFRVDGCSVEWVTTALQTISPGHRDFRRVSIYAPRHLTGAGADVKQTIAEQFLSQWLDLDRLLVRLWETRSIRPEVVCVRPHKNKQIMMDSMGCLLPELTKREVIDLAE